MKKEKAIWNYSKRSLERKWIANMFLFQNVIVILKNNRIQEEREERHRIKSTLKTSRFDPAPTTSSGKTTSLLSLSVGKFICLKKIVSFHHLFLKN